MEWNHLSTLKAPSSHVACEKEGPVVVSNERIRELRDGAIAVSTPPWVFPVPLPLPHAESR